MNQTVNTAGQADEHAEVGDRLNLALDLVALLEALVEFFPGVRLALLHAEADATTVFVDVKNHDFDFFAELNDLLRINVLVGPIHFGHVHETFDAGFDFNKSTVVGDVGHLAEQTGVLGVAAGNADPRIFAQLLEAEGNAALFLVELEDLSFDFLTDRHHFARVTHAAPGEVGNVQQAVDAAEVNKRTVIGDVLDDTLDNGTFLERSEQLGAFFAHAGFHDSAAGNHHVVALAVELDHLEFEGLAFERGGVLDRTGVDERTRQEGTDAVGHDGEAALDLAGDGTGDEFAGFQSLFEVHPGSQALGLVAGKNRFAETVFGRFDCHGNEVAGLNGHFTEVVLEFFDGHIGFGLQAGVHNHEVVFDAQHFGGDNFTLTHFLLSEAFLKKLGKRFGIGSVGHEN